MSTTGFPENEGLPRIDLHSFQCPVCASRLTQDMVALCDLVDRYRASKMAEAFMARGNVAPLAASDVKPVASAALSWLSGLRDGNKA